MKVKTICKSFKRVLNDGNYGSLSSETFIEVEVEESEDYALVSKQLFQDVKSQVICDLASYMKEKREGKAV